MGARTMPCCRAMFSKMTVVHEPVDRRHGSQMALLA